MGATGNTVRLVVSTIPEIEHLLPVLQEFQSTGRNINVLYGIPLPRSQTQRLASIGRQLGPGTISVLIDHPSQIHYVSAFADAAGYPAGVFVKIDTGYHRAGLPPSGVNKDDLLTKLMRLDKAGQAEFLGLYSHSSLSYNGSTPREAMQNLEIEIDGCLAALWQIASLLPQDREVTISVGASPQVTAVENLVYSHGDSAGLHREAEQLRQTIQRIAQDRTAGFRTKLELHAGVYCVMDLQQLSTNARGALLGDCEDEIAVSVVAEVCSVYNNGEREQPEALLAVGTLGLGREPCMNSKGWGVLRHRAKSASSSKDRLIIERISQEHCIVKWDESENNAKAPFIPLEVGQAVQIFPNHACVAGALYGWYLVVDSSSNDQQIVDVWVRASGF